MKIFYSKIIQFVKLKFFVYFFKKKQKIEYQELIFSSSWEEVYSSWEEASRFCKGYDDSKILKKCIESLTAVKNRDAIYERDSVLFDKKEYSTGLLSALFLTASNYDRRLSIIDFGGSLGSSYYQNNDFFYLFKDIKWSIVEQEHFYEAGLTLFANDQLNFYNTIEECLIEKKPNIFLISGSLQYVQTPEEILSKISNSNVNYLVFDRIPFSSNDNFITIQQVPPQIYDASYPCWIFNENWLLNKLNNYKLLYDFPSYCDANYVIKKNNITVNMKGFVLELKK